MSQSRQQWLLAAVSSLVFFVNLGATRLWDVDEAIFSQAAVEMHQRGDLVVPYFNGEMFPDKPALTYWCMIAAYQLFGTTEFSARFFSALCGVGSVLLTYRLGRHLFSPRVGFWAGLILATNLNFGIISRAATPDALLTFFTLLAVWLFARGTIRPAVPNKREELSDRITEPTWQTYALVYAAMGAAVMVKGPVGVVLPTAVLGLFLLLTTGPNAIESLPSEIGGQRWGWLRRALDAALRTASPAHFLRTVWNMRPLLALTMVLLVAGPWYVWAGLKTDWAWPAQFFGVHNIGRFMNPMDGHRGPIFFYVAIILVLFFPWSILMLASIYELYKRVSRQAGRLFESAPASRTATTFADNSNNGAEASPNGRAGGLLVASWLVVYIGFFSLASTKLPNYIIPCYPALALMTALFVERWVARPTSIPRWVLGVAFGILGVAGASMLFVGPAVANRLGQAVPTIGLVGLVPLVGAGLGIVFVVRQRYRQAAATLGATAVGFTALFFAVTVTQAGRFHTAGPFLATIDEHSGGAPHVATYRHFRPSMVFYGGQAVPKLASPEDVAAFFAAQPRDAFLYTMGEQLEVLKGCLPADVVVLREQPKLFSRQSVVLLGRESDHSSAASKAKETDSSGTTRVGQSPADDARR